jgi:hypothetical protein
MEKTGQFLPDFDWYQRKGDNLQFGDAGLWRISYLAYKGKLFQARLEASGDNKRKLVEAAIATFGQLEDIKDPKSFGYLWPQTRKGPLTGTKMRGGAMDGTIVSLVEEHLAEIIGAHTFLSFTDAATAQFLNANAPKAQPARAGDF